jgi:peptidoglycan/LPS O-acetylase OafA/YrhL
MMRTKEKSYYPYFDYLRIVLVTVVMLAHDGVLTWPYSGKLAVDVFFALSGWLIGGILIRTDIEDLSRFYFNRALRIWIPYYLAFTLIIIVGLLKDPINQKWFEFVIYKVTWVYNYFGPPQLETFRDAMPLDGTGNHFWSVNAEEQFYLLAPLLLVVFAKYGRKIITWLLVVAFFWYMWVYAPISLGVLAAVVNAKYPGFYAKRVTRALLLVAFLGATSGLAFTGGYKLYAPFFSISLVLLLAIKGDKQSAGSFLGGISYPLYLNHWIGVFFFNLVLEPFGLRESGIRNVLAAVMNYGIAAFLYWFIERKVLAMREKLYSVRKGVVFTCLAYLSIIAGFTFGFILSPSAITGIVWLLFMVTASIVMTIVLKNGSRV